MPTTQTMAHCCGHTKRLRWATTATGHTFPLASKRVQQASYTGAEGNTVQDPNLQPGEYIGAINATTGNQMWNITFWSGGAFNTADGYLSSLKQLRQPNLQLSAKDQRRTTVQTPLGWRHRRTKLDSTGHSDGYFCRHSNRSTIAPRFPNGVPAVSDDTSNSLDGIRLHAEPQANRCCWRTSFNRRY